MFGASGRGGFSGRGFPQRPVNPAQEAVAQRFSSARAGGMPMVKPSGGRRVAPKPVAPVAPAAPVVPPAGPVPNIPDLSMPPGLRAPLAALPGKAPTAPVVAPKTGAIDRNPATNGGVHYGMGGEPMSPGWMPGPTDAPVPVPPGMPGHDPAVWASNQPDLSQPPGLRKQAIDPVAAAQTAEALKGMFGGLV